MDISIYYIFCFYMWLISRIRYLALVYIYHPRPPQPPFHSFEDVHIFSCMFQYIFIESTIFIVFAHKTMETFSAAKYSGFVV
ncbi:hypothetical protein Barb6_03160 [Bacteroidales bacterium Barb6]|nr:hypothetical protein Barb6_03160 [Bacteroidales bacterium Barb6]